MILRKPLALLATLAICATPAFAQDAETATPEDNAAEQAAPAEAETPAEAEPATTEAPAAAATEEAASGEPALGSYYARTTHGDWTIRCIKTDQDADPCELYQLLEDSTDNAVAEITLIPLRNGEVAAGATLIAPLETDLIQGLGLAIDNGQARGYPFSFCAPVGCVSRLGFTEAELNSLKRGSKATVTLLPFGGNPQEPVQLDMSLAGFTAAFSEVEQIVAEATGAAQE